MSQPALTAAGCFIYTKRRGSFIPSQKCNHRLIRLAMADVTRYTSEQDARAHGAICDQCKKTAVEVKLLACAGCKLVR
jgi:hypothetical protein